MARGRKKLVEAIELPIPKIKRRRTSTMTNESSKSTRSNCASNSGTSSRASSVKLSPILPRDEDTNIECTNKGLRTSKRCRGEVPEIEDTPPPTPSPSRSSNSSDYPPKDEPKRRGRPPKFRQSEAKQSRFVTTNGVSPSNSSISSDYPPDDKPKRRGRPPKRPKPEGKATTNGGSTSCSSISVDSPVKDQPKRRGRPPIPRKSESKPEEVLQMTNGGKKKPCEAPKARRPPAPQDLVIYPCEICHREDHTNVTDKFHSQVSLLRSLIRSALNHIESNTVLIIGQSGIGKTTVIDYCLKSEKALDKCVLIKLNGVMETEESLAFKSINYQLEDVSSPSLTIPSLMETIIQEEKDQMDRKPFVILVDVFDVFCRKNQSLLYNLFDVTRKCKHVLVIGSTTRIDAPELLEKRVKSRMNQIMIYLASPFSNFDEYVLFAKRILSRNHGMNDIPDHWMLPLKNLHKKTSSIRELNKLILQLKFQATLPSSQSSQSSTQSTIPNKCDDNRIGYLTSLSYLELAVLVQAFKNCKVRQSDSITVSTIIKLAASLPSQMVHDKLMLFKVINNLIESGFAVLASNSKMTSFMTERTEVLLNVDDRNLKQALLSIQNSVPSNLKNLLTL